MENLPIYQVLDAGDKAQSDQPEPIAQLEQPEPHKLCENPVS